MRHLGTQIINTKRLVLRPFTVADARAMFTSWSSDDRVTKHLSWVSHTNVDVTEKMLAENVKKYESNQYYMWAITLANSGEIIGSMGVHPSKHGDFFEPGYCIGFKYWTSGYTTEALAGVCNFMLNQVGLDKLICCHDSENTASGKVMEKVGFKYSHDGEYLKADGTSRPCRCYMLYKGD